MKYRGYEWSVYDGKIWTVSLVPIITGGEKTGLIEDLKKRNDYFTVYGEQEGYVCYVIKGKILDDWSSKDQEAINESKKEFLSTKVY